MFKRFAALFFILAMAGHAAAGVCRCLSGESKPTHSCCKRQKTGSDSMRRPMCCDTDCTMRGDGSVPQARIEAAVKLTVKTDVVVSHRLRYTPLIAAVRPAAVKLYAEHLLKRARPPDLYLQHHAFLI